MRRRTTPRFYGTLYAIGVNSVVWVDGENQIEVELTKIARQADFSQLEPKKQPLFNSTLQLSGIYFMQELRRPLKKEERTANMREMEEELIVNLKKSEFLVAMATDPEDPKKVNIPYLRQARRYSSARLSPMLWNLTSLQEARSFVQPRFHLRSCRD